MGITLLAYGGAGSGMCRRRGTGERAVCGAAGSRAARHAIGIHAPVGAVRQLRRDGPCKRIIPAIGRNSGDTGNARDYFRHIGDGIGIQGALSRISARAQGRSR